MNSNLPDPRLPDFQDELRRTDAVDDWGHAPGLLDEDQRVYMPTSSQSFDASAEHRSRLAPLLDSIRSGKQRAQHALETFDKEEALEKGRELIIRQPWPAALLTFAFGAWLGRKLTHRS